LLEQAWFTTTHMMM